MAKRIAWMPETHEQCVSYAGSYKYRLGQADARGRMLTVSFRQVHAFRLQRHHLLGGKKPGFLTVCSDICGAQAQIMSSAYATLWARVPGLTRTEIISALSE